MRRKLGAVGLAAGALLYFHGPLARADDKVAIQVTNDNTDDVIVSLYDMNTTPRSKLLSHQRINGFASIPIAVTAGADGNGHVYWTAVRAKSGARQCGRKDEPGLAADASVHVHAKADCPAR